MPRKFIPPTESDIVWEFHPYDDIHRERIRAHAKHDDFGGSMERKHFRDPAWLPVLVEEVGEVAEAICDYRHEATPHAREVAFAQELRDELVQVAAMAVAWIDAIDMDVLLNEPPPSVT